MAYSPGNLIVFSDLRDDDQGDAVVLSRGTGATLASISTFPNSGFGDILSSGIFAITKQQVTGSKLAGVSIYNSDLGLITTVTAQAVATPLRWGSPLVAGAPSGHTFYFLAQPIADPFTPTLYTYSDAGVVGGTTWTFSSGAGAIQPMAVNLAGTILYWGIPNVGAAAINRYDLVNSTPLSALVAATATNTLGNTFVVDQNDDVITAYQTTSGQDWQLRRYNSSGVLQLTTALGPNLWADEPEVFSDSDPDYVWVRTFPDVDGETSRFRRFLIETGAVDFDWTVDTLIGAGDVPVTCPNIVLRAPETPTETFPIRRQRRFLLPSSPDNKNMQIPVIELLMRTGIGLTEGPAADPPVQGSDPQVMIRLSKDGGKTWGNERWISAGKIGQYLRRVRLLRATGNYRNAVLEVTTSDPNDFQFLAALAPNGIIEGSS